MNGTARRLFFWVSVLLVAASPSSLSAADKLNVSVRGRTLTLAIYRPPARPAGTVLMGSGDVGWVGLAVSLADELCAQGYLVVGLNTRQYLSSFTFAKSHLQPADLHADFRTIRDALASRDCSVPSRDPVRCVGRGRAVSARGIGRHQPRLDRWRDHDGLAGHGGARLALDRRKRMDHEARR